MSYDTDENLCPKCGLISASYEICDNCGALLNRMRNRGTEYAADQPQEIPGREAYAPGGFYEEPARKPWLTIIALCILVVAGIAGYQITKNHRAAESKKPQSVQITDASAPSEPDTLPAASSTQAETPVPAADAAEPEEKPLRPDATVTPSARAAKPPLAGTPTASTSQKAANLLSWLNNIQAHSPTPKPSPSSEASPAVPPSVKAPAASTPLPAQLSSLAARRPTPAVAKQTKAAGDIELGEEVFSRHNGPKSDRVNEVMQKLDSEQATPAEQLSAAQIAAAKEAIARVGAAQSNADSAPAPAETSPAIVAVDDSNFQTEVLTYTDAPVLLAFYSPKVPSSNADAPVLMTLAQQQDPKVKIGVVDVDQGKGVKQRYTISDLPTCVLIKNGQEFARFGPEVSVAAVNEQVRLSAIKNLPHEDRPQ